MKKIKRKDGRGFILKFDNGRMYSVVNLGIMPCFSNEPTSPEASKEREKAGEMIGEMYDKMGGRFEAIEIVGEGFGELYRGQSFDDVIKVVKDYEKTHTRK
jgi:hypothetical protein